MASSRSIRLSAMDQLIFQRKLNNDSKNEEDKVNKHIIESLIEGKTKETSSITQDKVNPSKLDEEDHPERAIPDIPENKRVRDYLKSQPLMGHGAAFGKAIRIVQCYRCKCYGHRAGDPECKYTESGDLNLELQRRVREDPMYCFKKMNGKGGSDRIQRMKELLMEAKQEKKHHRHKRKHRHKENEKISHYSSSSES